MIHKINLFKSFNYTYLLMMVLASATPMLYWIVSKNFAQLPKIVYALAIIFMIVALFKNKFLLNHFLVKFTLLYGSFLLFYGLAINGLTHGTATHLKMLILIVVGSSFGYLYALKYKHHFKVYTEKILIFGYIMSSVIILYYVLHSAGMFAYFGASSLVFLPIFFLLKEKRYALIIFFFIMLLLTGKRSQLLVVTLVIIIFLLKNHKMIAPIFLSLFIAIIVFNYDKIDILYRFLPLIDALSTMNTYDLNIATSGRINDIIGAYEALDKSIFFWLFGKGVGGIFTVVVTDGLWETSYTHFTPLSFIFLGGIVFATGIYIVILQLLLFAIKNINNFFSMLFVYQFFISIVGGANYVTNPFVWFVVGIMIYSKKKKCLIQL